MATVKKETTQKPVEKKYHFFNDEYSICIENATEEEFIEDTIGSQDNSDATYFRVPVELMEKIKIERKIVTIK